MITDPDSIDLFGVRKDGGADLVIVSGGPLDESPETQALLLDKIEAYLGYINSPAFHEECPQATAKTTRIILRLSEPPTPLMRQFLERIVPWTTAYHTSFFVELAP